MKTRMQLRKMDDKDVVAYLLKNHYWHIVKFYEYRNQLGDRNWVFKIAGFQLKKEFSMSEYGGRYMDKYVSSTDYSLLNIEQGYFVYISKADGEKLYDRLERQYKTRHARRIVLSALLSLACGACIWAGRAIHKHNDTDTHQPPTSNTTQVIISGPCNETNTFYYYENGRQH